MQQELFGGQSGLNPPIRISKRRWDRIPTVSRISHGCRTPEISQRSLGRSPRHVVRDGIEIRFGQAGMHIGEEESRDEGFVILGNGQSIGSRLKPWGK